MSDPETLPSGVHPEVQQLPWYATGTLAEPDRQRIARHLESCRDCSRELEEFTELQRTLATLYRQEGNPSAQLAQSVMARVAGDDRGRRGRALEESSRTSRIDGWFRSLLVPQWVPTLAAVLLVTQMGLLIWITLPPMVDRDEISTRSLGTHAAKIAVVFQPSATEQQIRSLLERLHARFVDGPTEGGVFMIMVNTSDPSASAALGLLRQERDVIRSADLVRS